MLRRQPHLSDPELLLLDEDELSPRRSWYARKHLTACASCAARSDRLGRALAEISRLHRASLEEPRSAGDLRSRLQTARWAGGVGSSWLYATAPVRTPRSWMGAAAVVVVAFLALHAMDTTRMRLDDAAFIPPETGPVLPRPDLTPGATRPVSIGEVCGGTPPSAAGPRVEPSVPRQVFRAYGADYRRSDEYELDFLITPELGGTTDVKNLWPQPFVSTPWNAYVKDELERLLQRKVCEGSLDIETAQAQMATDWIAAYKRYFNTNRPLRDYVTSPIGAQDVNALRSEAAERQFLPVATAMTLPGSVNFTMAPRSSPR